MEIGDQGPLKVFDFSLLIMKLVLAGLVVGLSGVYLLLNFSHSRHFFRDIHIILPAVLAIVSAAALLSSGGLGCWASNSDSNCLQASMVGLVSVAQLMKQQPLQEYRILDRDSIN
ncbi:hypothetical protein JZ751_024679 [Albula glossodonta]|uniref:Uncharacterized protein n=1 Tax=Albula glossodonta TaxID=121402 RepID=A0A8T2PFA0_9TELE|nr:hypothetical protein JZ751_024679 [Albula glossodonta]